jgi:hypothetical protein
MADYTNNQNSSSSGNGGQTSGGNSNTSSTNQIPTTNPGQRSTIEKGNTGGTTVKK